MKNQGKKYFTFLWCLGILITLPVLAFSTFFNNFDTGVCVPPRKGTSYEGHEKEVEICKGSNSYEQRQND